MYANNGDKVKMLLVFPGYFVELLKGFK